MNDLITLGCVVASVAVYAYAGVRFVACPYIAREVERNCKLYPITAEDPAEVERWRREAASEGVGFALAWPITLMIQEFSRGLADSVPPTPTEAQQQIKARDRRIAELEHQLGMKKTW